MNPSTADWYADSRTPTRRSRARVIRPGRWWAVLRVSPVDVTVAAAISAVGVLIVLDDGDAGSAMAAAGMVLVGLPILLRRRSPLLALALVVMIGIWLNGLLFGVRVRCGAEIPAFAYLAFTAARVTTTRQRWTLAALYCAYVAGEGLFDSIMTPTNALPDAVLFAVLSLVAGELVRRRDLKVRQLRRDIATLHTQRQQTAQSAAEAERLRINTDLVPAIGDHLDGILAGVNDTRTALDTSLDMAAATVAFLAVEDAGRAALARMRDALGTLRASTPTTLRPAPDLTGLQALLVAFSPAARTRTEGPARPLDPMLELTAYRVVEHTLSILDPQHAPTTLVLQYRADALLVQLDGAALPHHAAPTRAALEAARIRAAVVGGTVNCRTHRGRLETTSRLPYADTAVRRELADAA